MENNSLYNTYTHFLMKDTSLIDASEKLDISMAGMSGVALLLSVTECTRLYNFCSNLKRKGNMWTWKDRDDYNAHNIYIDQYVWLQRLLSSFEYI